MSDNKIYTHRFVARIIIEAATPLVIGSGNKDIITNDVVVKDANGLPYIPGTSIAGIIRHSMKELVLKNEFEINAYDLLFGYHKESNKNKTENDKPDDSTVSDIGRGSEIIFTEARMIGRENKVIDGLQNINWRDVFYSYFKELPIRQHVRINHRGIGEDSGKFDEQVVYKGTRFCFEIEMVSDGNNYNQFEQVLKQLQFKTFRIGGGTRKGFGEIEIVSCVTKKFNLNTLDGLDAYLQKSSSLAEDWSGDSFLHSSDDNNWTKYELTITPEDFFYFGSGFGDSEVDMTPVTEDFISWDKVEPYFKNNAILIPATSIKGAMAHRVAFHYNKLNKIFADKIPQEELEKYTGKNNTAIRVLFGSEANSNDTKESSENQMRGNVIFYDIIKSVDHQDKILNHIAIDRFTGGCIDGALFSEKITYANHHPFEIKILVNNIAFKEDNVKEAFENSLKDICNGMLPLGGGVNRGHGCFKGELKCNGEIVPNK